MRQLAEVLKKYRGAGAVDKATIIREAGSSRAELNRVLADPHIQSKVVDHGTWVEVM